MKSTKRLVESPRKILTTALGETQRTQLLPMWMLQPLQKQMLCEDTKLA
jgi:hypothetical protein